MYAAKFIRDLEGFTGEAKLWQVISPSGEIHHVVTSATIVPLSGPETYVFECDENGVVTSWLDLPGSFRGYFGHIRAIDGYVDSLEQ
jgi:hypothetical protein